jgi:hypothetical protein
MNFSIAIVIEGNSLVGAFISNLKPAFLTALAVVLPSEAIIFPFCLKSGKFSKQ